MNILGHYSSLFLYITAGAVYCLLLTSMLVGPKVVAPKLVVFSSSSVKQVITTKVIGKKIA